MARSGLDRFLTELRRRRVYRVAAVYGVTAWLLLQVASIVFPALQIPAWGLRLVIAVLVLGFPVALGLAWAFDLGPDGLRRTRTKRKGRRAAAPAKGRAATLAVGGVAVAALVAWVGLGGGTAREAEGASVAVLPFENMSADPEQEYFSDGITEEILNSLAQVSALRVPARTSSFTFKDRNAPIREIAAALDVDHVLEGSVRKSGNRVRITAQLIDARTDRHLWSETYDRDLADVFAVQSDIARSITQALRVRLAGDSLPRLAAPVNREAHDLYLRGLYDLNRRGAHLVRAIAFLEEVIRLEPGFARAHGALALAMALAESHSVVAEPMNARSRAAAARAIALDPTIAEPHVALGFALEGWRAQEAALRTALSIDPDNATAYNRLAQVLTFLGREAEAIAAAERAVELDPATPMHRAIRGRVLFYARRYDEAERSLRDAYRSDPSLSLARNWMATLFLATGRPDSAFVAYSESRSSHDARSLEDVRIVIHATMDPSLRPRALEILTRGDPGWTHRRRVVFLARIGAVDQSLATIDGALAEHAELSRADLAVEPGFDVMRDHPRFRAILRELELPNRGPHGYLPR